MLPRVISGPTGTWGSFDDVVSPNVFAVFKLMTKSNLVGCSTGRLAGLAPFKILSTYPAATQAFVGANLDNAALPGVYLAVVMGRHAGFLTAASAMARKFPDDGPHLIYLPERSFVLAQFLADVKIAYERFGRCVIAVSEGIHDASGTPIAIQLGKNIERDEHHKRMGWRKG